MDRLPVLWFVSLLNHDYLCLQAIYCFELMRVHISRSLIFFSHVHMVRFKINQYFHEHFPKAIATANEARAKGGRPYKWMTQSWLVSLYRQCNSTNVGIGVKCPNATALAAFEAAVSRGDINWHAFPFNAEPELFTPELFDAALNVTFAEDDHFGHAHRRTLSQRVRTGGFSL